MKTCAHPGCERKYRRETRGGWSRLTIFGGTTTSLGMRFQCPNAEMFFCPEHTELMRGLSQVRETVEQR